jgi:flagellin
MDLNSMSISLLNQYRHVTGDGNTLTNQLSSGQRLVRSSIDPSGLAIAKGMQAQIRGSNVATHNAQETIQLLRLADSVLEKTTDLVMRIRDLGLRMANQATSNTKSSTNPFQITSSDQRQMYDEMGALAEEIRRQLGGLPLSGPPFIITESATKYNGKDLFFAAFDSGQNTQVGPNASAENSLSVVIPSMTDIADSVPVPAVPFPGTFTAKDFADFGLIQVTAMDEDIEKINDVRTILGSQANALENVINDLNTQTINLARANSQISDVNMAEAASELKQNMITQSTMNKALLYMNDMQSLKIEILGVLPIYMNQEK